MKKEKLPFIIWIILIGATISRIGVSISVPFITLFLHEKFGLSLIQTGLVVGGSFVFYVFGGFIGGALSDRFGRPILITSAVFLYSLIYFLFGLISEVFLGNRNLFFVFLILNFVSGISSSCIDVLSKALLSDYASEKSKILVFRLRYSAMNIGSAIGPAVGALFGISGSFLGFYFTAVIFLIYFFFLSFVFYKKRNDKFSFRKDSKEIKESFFILFKDNVLLLYIVAGILIGVGFIQQETILGQVLYKRMGDAHLYSMLLILNAVFVIFLQIPITKLFENNHPLKNMMLGSCFIFLGLIGFSFSGVVTAFYFVSEIVFTIGEILIFPFSGILIDKLAPTELRGAYFGASGFQYFGRAIGPILSGFFIKELKSESLGLFFISLISLSSILFYYFGYFLFEKRKEDYISSI